MAKPPDGPKQTKEGYWLTPPVEDEDLLAFLRKLGGEIDTDTAAALGREFIKCYASVVLIFAGRTVGGKTETYLERFTKETRRWVEAEPSARAMDDAKQRRTF